MTRVCIYYTKATDLKVLRSRIESYSKTHRIISNDEAEDFTECNKMLPRVNGISFTHYFPKQKTEKRERLNDNGDFETTEYKSVKWDCLNVLILERGDWLLLLLERKADASSVRVLNMLQSVLENGEHPEILLAEADPMEFKRFVESMKSSGEVEICVNDGGTDKMTISGIPITHDSNNQPVYSERYRREEDKAISKAKFETVDKQTGTLSNTSPVEVKLDKGGIQDVEEFIVKQMEPILKKGKERTIRQRRS